MLAHAPTRFSVRANPGIPRSHDATTFVDWTEGRNGAADALTFHSRWYPFTFTAVEPMANSHINASDYVGTYVSDELRSELSVTQASGHLKLRAPRGEHVMEPVSRDLFSAGPQLVRFTRKDGAIAGVVISRGALPHIAFTRR